MTLQEYLKQIGETEINTEVMEKVYDEYSDDLPEIVGKIITNAKEAVFLDGCRILSLEEILDASQDLDIDFKEKEMIPLIDCGDNDFVVYHFSEDSWSKFNIADETVFKKKHSLEELVKALVH